MEKQPINKNLTSSKKPDLDKFFDLTIKAQASDLHLKGNATPRMRVKGKLRHTTGGSIGEQKLEEMIFEILSPDQKNFFLEKGALDFAYDLGAVDRFRVNIFRQRGNVSLVARRVTSTIPPFQSLHLPPIVQDIAQVHQGLVLVTGVTGSGKSTTIASMLDNINRTRPCHIITIEDPIEFVYADDKALVSQREVGIDVPSYEDAMRSLMREDPDVVLIGEMRDLETIEAALRIAETGHLTFATLHTNSAYATINRLVDAFPPHQQQQIRAQLSLVLEGIICQTLLPKAGGDGRVCATEVLIPTSGIRNLIRENKVHQIYSAMQVGQVKSGMHTMNQRLAELVSQGRLAMEVALDSSSNADELREALKRMPSRAGAR